VHSETRPTDATTHALATLEAGIDALETSDAFRHYLQVAARFHSYSFGNQLLIASQMPSATRIAGFNTWLSLHRHVRRGEKAIRIIAPVVYKKRGKESDDDCDQARLAFRVVPVFDVSQTDGEDLPELAHQLTGDVARPLLESLTRFAFGNGLCFTDKEPPDQGINGYFDPAAQAIYVRPTLEINQRAKTLAHELGHARLRHGTDDVTLVSRANCEVAAETVAYIVCNAFGVNTAEYSYGYIVGWTSDRKERRSIITSASKVAGDIVAALGGGDSHMAE
jgi:antirestriction protein ArdC